MAGFRGSYTVMVTPFDESGGLDEATLRRFVDWQIEAACTVSSRSARPGSSCR